jgi:hypothetical protein
MTKEKRNLSGIYFRYQKEDGSYGSRVFEDLDLTEQVKVLEGKSEEWLKSCILTLAGTINIIGDKFDIKSEINNY